MLLAAERLQAVDELIRLLLVMRLPRLQQRELILLRMNVGDQRVHPAAHLVDARQRVHRVLQALAVDEDLGDSAVVRQFVDMHEELRKVGLIGGELRVHRRELLRGVGEVLVRLVELQLCLSQLGLRGGDRLLRRERIAQRGRTCAPERRDLVRQRGCLRGQ